MIKDFFLYCSLIGSFLFVACEQEVELSIRLPEERFALNGIVKAGASVIEVSLTEVVALSAPYQRIPVTDATVMLSEDAKDIGAMEHLGDGNYQLNHLVKEGATYSIHAYLGEEELTAQTTVPSFSEVTYHVDTAHYTTGQDGFLVTFKQIYIHDQPGSDFYWFYNLWENREGELKQRDTQRAVGKVLDDFNREFDPRGNLDFYLTDFVYNYGLRIEDAGFDGQKLQFTIRSGEPSFNKVMHVDEHYDKYLKSVVAQKLIDDGGIPIIEPIQIYSNVTNGFGIFASEAKTERWF